jgi:hypothetical protein
VPTTTFDTVVFDFDKTCEDVIKHYETLGGVILSKENIKFFFNSTIYGGGYSTWLDKLRNVTVKSLRRSNDNGILNQKPKFEKIDAEGCPS